MIPLRPALSTTMEAPTLVGYFPKRRTPRPENLILPGVEEIASVSTCIAQAPDGWIRHGLHNAWGFFDTPDLAWRTVRGESRPSFDLFAYELWPVRFAAGRPEGLEVPSDADPAPLRDGGFEFLGFDVVSNYSGHFECSPLSCNRWAAEVGSNTACLVDDREEALRLASIAEREGCEPGDYFVLGVWRRKGKAGE